MFARFTRAIVRPPARNFADGLTTVDIGVPNVDVALDQHAAYCAALVRHGCAIVALPADSHYPDSTFVEDTALIRPGQGAIFTRPGAVSRAGEVDAMRQAMSRDFPHAPAIVAPGTLDAGDVCEAGAHVFIGISQRTNHDGAAALASHAAFHDYEVLRVPDGEEYAANCVRVNDVVFVAAGYPQTHAMLRALGYALEVLDMSEYAKMDGGLSCLSLRY